MTEPQPLPIACTLAGASLAERAEWLGRLGQAALIHGARDGGALRLEFRPEAADDVRELVRAENECCPFLDFDVRTAGDSLALTVTGPPDAAPVLDDMLAALSGRR